MDTSYYKNFLTLVETDNMTQAAEILHITQPALSKQLKYLEAEFGTPLLIIKRGQKGPNFHLTEAGQLFYKTAQQLCSIENSVYNDIKRLNSEVEGILKIASAASRSTSLIQRYILPFSKKNPAVHYEIYEGLMADVIDSLLKGSAEIGLCNYSMVDQEKFDILHTQEESLFALFRRDIFWPNDNLTTITWEKLSQTPLSLCGGSIKMLLQSYKESFSELNIVSVTTTKSSAIEWAQSGHTVAVIPMEQNELVNRPRLTKVKLVGLPTPFKKAFICTKNHKLSLVAQQFLEFYTTHLEE